MYCIVLYCIVCLLTAPKRKITHDFHTFRLRSSPRPKMIHRMLESSLLLVANCRTYPRHLNRIKVIYSINDDISAGALGHERAYPCQ